MLSIIDLGSEFLIDSSVVSLPELRLLLAAIGRPTARGSAWLAVRKEVAALYSLPASVFGGCPRGVRSARLALN